MLAKSTKMIYEVYNSLVLAGDQGEKALQRGLVDILVKEATPIGRSYMIVIEVKNRAGSINDLSQLAGYRAELGDECAATLLAARKFTERMKQEARKSGIGLIRWDLNLVGSKALNYEGLENVFTFSLIEL